MVRLIVTCNPKSRHRLKSFVVNKHMHLADYITALRKSCKRAATDSMQACAMESSELQVVFQLTTSVAVVGCTEDGNNILVMAPIIPFHHKLVRPRYKCQAVCMIELLRYILAKCVACSSG